MLMFGVLFAMNMLTLSCQPLEKIATDIAAIRGSQEAMLSSISDVRHASAWRFPQGPMSLGCLIMAAGVAFGICVVCVWFQYKWDSLVRDATGAIRAALIVERRQRNVETSEEGANELEMVSMMGQGTDMGSPPAYDEII